MAWTAARTWVTGELVTSTMLNTHIRDNLNAISSIPAARVYNSANVSIPNNTDTALPFDSERFDTDAIHDPASNNTRLTCKTAGKYAIGGQSRFNGVAGGAYRLAKILLSPAGRYIAFTVGPPLGTLEVHQNVQTIEQLAVNDYVELVVAQDSGGALNQNTVAADRFEFWMQRLSD